MPDSIVAVLIALLAIVPGALGVFAYALVAGTDWRQKDWESIAQHIAFSAGGVLLYSVVAHILHCPPPIHVIPSTYSTLTGDHLYLLLVPFAGHLVFAAAVGAATAEVGKRIEEQVSRRRRAGAWDYFVTASSQGRWVLVTLKEGTTYFGRLVRADAGVPTAERDVVLRETERREGTEYVRTRYHDLYIPAGLIHAIATVETESDKLHRTP